MLAGPVLVPDTLTMSAQLSLANHFLIAMPSLQDPNFARTVTLICEHNEQGAMGIVINRPTDLIVRDVVKQLEIEESSAPALNLAVHVGGPVQANRGFVIHEPLGKWDSTLAVSETLGVSTSRDIIVALAEARGPQHFLLALGYAGWEAGQLEKEMAENAWLSTPADMAIVFALPPDERWDAAARLVGVDIANLSPDAGHA